MSAATSPCEGARAGRRALDEDIGTGDVTTQLVAAVEIADATVISREAAVICGRPWVDEVFRTLDPQIAIGWQVAEGERIVPDQALYVLRGPARALLTGERTALNFLQTLSGTATELGRASWRDRVWQYV